MKRRTRHPRGVSLGELLAVLSGLGVAMAVATGLVHTGMRQQSTSRQELERDRTALRLARDFREDVRQAAAVQLGENLTGAPDEADEAGESLMELTLADGTLIIYRTTPQGLTRLRGGEGRRVHEDYVFGVPLVWEAKRDDGCLVLTGAAPDPDASSHQRRAFAPLEMRLVAAEETP